jgi:hypothetical protein
MGSGGPLLGGNLHEDQRHCIGFKQLVQLIIPVAFCWDLTGHFVVVAEADRPVALRSEKVTIDKTDINKGRN